MTTAQTQFNIPHNEAFTRLGALAPSQHWSAFDVRRDEARNGKAKLFVTTIWNFHSILEKNGRRIVTERAIAKDRSDGTIWYRVARPSPGNARKTGIAHWTGLHLALEMGIPIVGVLKDVRTEQCSLDHLFDCGNPRREKNGGSIWLELRPRGDIGCEVIPIDIRELTIAGQSPDTFDAWRHRFEQSVREALKSSSARRRARLAKASPLPRRIEVVTTVFERNPDMVAEVLLRAKGICEKCKRPAPFLRRSDKSPYLEVHHRISLGEGGEDTVANAIALCPNCHRAAHFA